MPWNEVSRRYVDSDPEFYEPDVWRMRADNVKQGSRSSGLTEHEVDIKFTQSEEQKGYTDVPSEINFQAIKSYKALLEAGVCPEQARMVLPQSMYTEWIWSGTLGAFLDMLVLRLDPHTQKETRMIAEMIALDIKRLFPVSYNVVVEGD